MERVLNHIYPGVVSKSVVYYSNHGLATTAHRTLGVTPAGTMCHDNLCLGFYPKHRRSFSKAIPIFYGFCGKSFKNSSNML